MKIDAEKFLAMTVLLATTAGAPGCKGEEKKADPKEVKTATPPATPAPAAQPPAVPPAPAVAPVDPAAAATAGAAGDSAGAAAGGAKAKPDPGPEEEKPSW